MHEWQRYLWPNGHLPAKNGSVLVMTNYYADKWPHLCNHNTVEKALNNIKQKFKSFKRGYIGNNMCSITVAIFTSLHNYVLACRSNIYFLVHAIFIVCMKTSVKFISLVWLSVVYCQIPARTLQITVCTFNCLDLYLFLLSWSTYRKKKMTSKGGNNGGNDDMIFAVSSLLIDYRLVNRFPFWNVHYFKLFGAYLWMCARMEWFNQLKVKTHKWWRNN